MCINLGLFWHFETITNIRAWIKAHILNYVVRCKYFDAGIRLRTQLRTHIKMVYVGRLKHYNMLLWSIY